MEEGIDLLNTTVKAVLIVSGRMGQVLLPKINHMKNLLSVIVFCGNVQAHKAWANNFDKVKGVVIDFNQALILSD
jgi:hypothetical protein